MKSLVSTEWLGKNIKKVRIIDASWHLPNTNRNAYEEFEKEHLENSIFFDIDKNSNHNSELPHMLTKKKEWENIISNYGIKNSDHVVVYDNSDIISSCRVWYNFLYFDHNPNLISVLDGGLFKWKKENRSLTYKVPIFKKSKYMANENFSLVLNKNKINNNIKNNLFDLVDARSKNRFLGLEKEPRPGLRSGSIKNSYCLPFMDLINKEDKTFKDKEFIKKKFKDIGIVNENNIVFSCGSGITASVLALAYSMINDKYSPTVYDGSWAEYGMIK